ncbi:MAG: hypothetical protein PG981_001149 [Wolbachia endosymbiont of Ctenocephalides orientis wCori]|nr:MAG: hypothetical protein PG981_001149 [Wolbachia endosymbiont of Ctenocephalides orientis wCori]
MKIKRLFTLAALFASSLASAVDLSDLQDQYYAGLNFGGGYNGGLNVRPNVIIGYHLDKISKLELEVGGYFRSIKDISFNPMINYRFYPDLDLDPVSLYVSAGLGGMFRIGGTADAQRQSSASIAEEDSPKVGQIDTDSGVGKGQELSMESSSTTDSILNKIAYKLKVGVDYAFTPQIIGAVGLMANGTLFDIKELAIPDAVLELGIRYNF